MRAAVLSCRVDVGHCLERGSEFTRVAYAAEEAIVVRVRDDYNNNNDT